MRFLNNKRSISSVLSKNVPMKKQLEDAYGESYFKVRDIPTSTEG